MLIDKNVESAERKHIPEILRLLFLSVAQLEIAMRDSNESVGQLTEAFTSMVERENEIADAIDQLPMNGGDNTMYQAIKRNTEAVSEKMQSAIVAFQFYDKLTQRLHHVGNSMEALGVILEDDERIEDREEWNRLRAAIKSKYSMREEHELFDLIMSGEGIREAIDHYEQKKKTLVINDIELF